MIARSQAATHQSQGRTDIKAPAHSAVSPVLPPQRSFSLGNALCKVTGTILGAACPLTFIKRAVKQQITGLYGFIMLPLQVHSPWAGWLRGFAVVAQKAGLTVSRKDSLVLVEHLLSQNAVTMSVFAQEDYLILFFIPVLP